MKVEKMETVILNHTQIDEEVKVLREHLATARRMADFYRAKYLKVRDDLEGAQGELIHVRQELDRMNKISRKEMKELMDRFMSEIRRMY